MYRTTMVGEGMGSVFCQRRGEEAGMAACTAGFCLLTLANVILKSITLKEDRGEQQKS